MTESKKNFNYKIIKSKNYKRLTVSIKRSQKIVVSAPKRVTNKQIAEFVMTNENWINNNLQRLEKDPKTKKHTYLDGDEFLFYGEKFKLELIKVYDEDYKKLKTILNNIFLEKDEKRIIITLNNEISEEGIKNIISDFYKKETRKIVDLQFEKSPIFKNIKPNITKIKIQKSNGRWGSCSKNNNINFSNRLVMLPIECIDYVIFHEITHLFEKNHGIQFYKKLEEFCPMYKYFEKEIIQIERTYNVSLA